MTTAKYLIAQFDAHRIDVSTKLIKAVANADPASNDCWFYTTALGAGDSTVYYDDLVLTSEDL